MDWLSGDQIGIFAAAQQGWSFGEMKMGRTGPPALEMTPIPPISSPLEVLAPKATTRCWLSGDQAGSSRRFTVEPSYPTRVVAVRACAPVPSGCAR